MGRAKESRPPPRRFRGVYERQPGRWVADFRSHRLNVRRWIGTFPSEAEAKAAYDDFVTRFSLSGYVQVAIATAPPADLSRNGHKIDLVSDESDQSEMRLKQDAGAEMVPSSAPCMSSLTSPLPSPPLPEVVMPHEALPYADERQMVEPFLAEDLASSDLIAVADLANLPLPSLDDKLDFSSGDWSLASTGLQ